MQYFGRKPRIQGVSYRLPVKFKRIIFISFPFVLEHTYTEIVTNELYENRFESSIDYD